MEISQSEVVYVRRARWRVANIQEFERCRLLTLVGIEPSNIGVERRLLTPFDSVQRVDRRVVPRRISLGFWRRLCRAVVAADTPAGGLLCAADSRFELMPHQLEPALALVRGLGSRVLLADEVGLGKTVQAGLIVRELAVRGSADRVLVVAPAGLRDQWADELRGRFDLAPTVADVRSLRQLAATLPAGANPWQAVPLAIASVDYLKRPDVLTDVSACHWDLVIVDEAHGVAGNSDRRAAVAALAARAPYVVLLTATPHSGDRDAFASLCRLGSAGHDDALMTFRRTRQDVGLARGRRIHRLSVRPTAPELLMHARLGRFVRQVRHERDRVHDSGVGLEHPLALALSVLRKRAWSSAWSLQRSVERRLTSLPSGSSAHTAQLDLPFDDRSGELSPEDAPPPWSPLLALGDARRERQLLEGISAAAEAAAAHESRIAVLKRLLRRTGEPVVVFTEYRDTLLHLQALLGEPAVLLHGGLPREERRHALEQFAAGSPRVLLTTDAAGEGLNLHQRCRLVVNLELPWNPMRLEQRIGRVDRIGQRRTVHAFHLVGRGTDESTMFHRLHSRLARARTDIGTSDPLGSGKEDRAVVPAHAPLDAPTLSQDAIDEARRLAKARALVRADDRHALNQLEQVRPAWAKTDRRKTRARLGGRMLTLWRAGALDLTGRVAASVLVAATLDQRSLAGLESLEGSQISVAAEPRLAEAMEVHRSFIACRLRRERAIGAAVAADATNATAFQPGLFDRRTEQARLAIVAGERATASDSANRVAALERALLITVEPPQLLLVLAVP